MLDLSRIQNVKHSGNKTIAACAACKAAGVRVIAKEKLGGGYITVVFEGDVAAVTAALESTSRERFVEGGS